ncbi:hypothetical protein [Pseudomonas yangonensis]|nr:hypothetical protein [Pseudomonas yangonensis]
MLDEGADHGPFDYSQALCNALPVRLVQGLLHSRHKHKARIWQSAP